MRLNVHDISLYGIGIIAFFVLIFLLYLTCKYMDRKVEGYSSAPSRVASCHEFSDKSIAFHIEMDEVTFPAYPSDPIYENKPFTSMAQKYNLQSERMPSS
ncbi:hypothetical protein L596_004931 [Steinernema carpocapsae]|uniref:Uncharacterized protein n=1 Tax=Steinernema carpocapsae TaxID=34508 RepID=A0A4U8UXB4_STECR|nr:hypothetical protein L596_004931 [Steinernema carpocapsae]